ncbi:MAG: hypothetical protein QG585_218, partial [Patescibacteria group bacterium]|nr:hypothetical protein [Patescibacteria group bacterium]
MKILFVTKDLGAANAAIPVALLAREQGLNLHVLAEGKSIQSWKSAGFVLGFASEGQEFPDGRTFPMIAKDFFIDDKPDVAVVTQSSPCYLEQKMALQANDAGVPVAFIEDFWAGHRRTTAKPDLVLTLDEAGADLARASYADGCEVVIAGNPSVKEVIPSSATLDEMGILRQGYDRVFLFVGASPEPTTAELELLIECLKQTKDNWCLVPAFHPKHAQAMKDGVLCQDIWQGMLAIFGDRIVSIPSAKNSDELAVLCDATFAAHSLTLISAVVGGRQAASLWTPASEASLSRQVGLLTFPLVSMGLPQIREVVSLDSVPMVPASLSAKLRPFDPNVALEA